MNPSSKRAPVNATRGLIELIDLISSWREIHQEQKDDLTALKERIQEPPPIRIVSDGIIKGESESR